MTPIEKQLRIIKLIADTIRDCKQIPSGHLYAMLMTTGMTLEYYQSIIDILEKVNLITIDGFHMITWKDEK